MDSNLFKTFILGTKIGYRGLTLEEQLKEKEESFINIWGMDHRYCDQSLLIQQVYNSKAEFLMGRNLTLGEICCALGHREIYSNFLETDLEWALVLEDDARLVSREIPYLFLGKVERSKPCIIQLYGLEEALAQLSINRVKNQLTISGQEDDLYRLNFTPELTHAYFINRLAARKLLESTKKGVYSTADWPLLATNGLVFYSSSKPVFMQNAEISLLADDRLSIGKIECRESHKLRTFLNLLGLKALLGIAQGINPLEVQKLVLRRFLVNLTARNKSNFLFRRVQ